MGYIEHQSIEFFAKKVLLKLRRLAVFFFSRFLTLLALRFFSGRQPKILQSLNFLFWFF